MPHSEESDNAFSHIPTPSVMTQFMLCNLNFNYNQRLPPNEYLYKELGLYANNHGGDALLQHMELFSKPLNARLVRSPPKLMSVLTACLHDLIIDPEHSSVEWDTFKTVRKRN